MSSPIGLLGAVIPSPPAGGQTLYTTVVTNDTELAAALTSNSGDTFITAGDYTIDLDTLGALDTTPRRFVGAGPDPIGTGPGSGLGVFIEIISTGIGLPILDFSAGQTEAEGVGFENIFWFSSAPIVPAFFTGCWGIRNCHFDGGSALLTGISDTRNIVNCTFTNGGAGSGGFASCQQLVNCTVGSIDGGLGAESGFIVCDGLTNCSVFYEPTGAPGAFTDGFFFCTNMTNCLVDATNIAGGGTYRAARGCTEIQGFRALGPTAGAVATIFGMEACDRLVDCQVERFDINYNDCEQMRGCISTQGTGAGAGARTHFTFCSDMESCRVDGTGDDVTIDGFENCNRLTNCLAANNTGHGFEACSTLSNCTATDATLDGFNGCLRLSGCLAGNCGSDGFENCDRLSACLSQSNTANGYNACENLSACRSDSNTLDGFVDCAFVAGCTSSGDSNQFSGSSTRNVDFYSNSFQHLITPAQITANQNDYAGMQHASLGRLSTDASRNVTGIAPGGASHVDRFLRIVNVGANDLVLTNQDAASTAGNRIITGTGASLTVAADGAVDLWYDTTTARWRVLQS